MTPLVSRRKVSRKVIQLSQYLTTQKSPEPVRNAKLRFDQLMKNETQQSQELAQMGMELQNVRNKNGILMSRNKNGLPIATTEKKAKVMFQEESD